MNRCDALVIGGGPAGLRAAEIVSASGRKTILADHMPSVGRKFLVAGRGGLNLTHSEPVENFPARYRKESSRWTSLLADFSPDDLRAWAKDLGIETFVGTSGRVFPTTKQAAPLLRRWVDRIRKQGVSFRPRHRLVAFRVMEKDGEIEAEFATPQGSVLLQARAMILALGGASWAKTGSDGEWVKLFSDAAVRVTPLTPANCGYEVDWPPEFLAQTEGLPLKNITVQAGKRTVAGELLITNHGLEGGAIYQLGPDLRHLSRPQIVIDLKPAHTAERLTAKIRHAKPEQLFSQARAAWKLSPVAEALLKLRTPFQSPEDLAAAAKAYPLDLRGPRPIDEAISTAGGVSWDELDADLMLKRRPGVFCAGEMIDWEAPTGGYLLQGCFSTACRAAKGAEKFLHEK